MPNIKAAKKSLRQTKKRTQQNIQRKKVLKDLVKKTVKAAQAGKSDEVKELLRHFQKAIDKTVKVGLIKKNNANRKKSRLVARVSQMLKK
jgi:small subunit ribosomal protein S20